MNSLRRFLARDSAFFFSVPAVLWQVVFLLIPLITILYFSIWNNGLTLEYFKVIMQPVYWLIILRSLMLSCGAAFICLICAYPVAYFLALYIERFKGLFLFLLTLPFWISSLIQIYAWFYLLEYHGLINRFLMALGLIQQPLQLANGIVGIFIVMCYCYLPFMIMPLYSSLSKLDMRLLEASADLGATSWQTFINVTLPLSLSGIKTGLTLVLVPAFGEFAIPSLLGGGKYMLVGSLISYYFVNVRDNGLGAAFTILSGCVLLLITYMIHKIGTRTLFR